MNDDPSALLALFSPKSSIYLPGATGESLALAGLLAGNRECMRGVRLISCFVPGMNETLDYAGLSPESQLTTFMLPRVMRESFQGGRVDLIPATYWGAAQYLASTRCNVAIAHVAPPDEDGNCSLGIASDFAPLVWPHAKRKVLLINPSMPRLLRAPSLPLADSDLVVTLDGPLIEAAVVAPDAVLDKIAKNVANLVPDGAHLQTGIGGAPGVVWQQLCNHREIVLRSGMANDWLRDLHEAGALAANGDHVAGIAYGTSGFYDFLAQTDLVRFATTLETHGTEYLAQLPRLTSINSALEIDLFGQVNIEWTGSRLSGGVGGGPDFMRAARTSPGGRSIIALPATAKRGTVSRIVARLDKPTAGIARSDIDTVVTEHGVADLRNKGIDARADALIGVADPALRDGLDEAWRQLRAAM